MTVLCGACNAENRDAAKFCKGCGRKIAQAWPQAAAATPLAVSAGDATVLLGAAAAARVPDPVPAAPPVEEIHSMPAPLRPRIGNGRWIAALAASVALMIVVAAWWGHNNRGKEIPEPAASAPAETRVAALSPAPEPAASVAEPAAAAASVTAATAPPLELAEKPEPAQSAEAAPVAAPKPRKPVAKKQAAPAPAPVVEAVAPAPPPPVAEPVRVPTPQESCAGRNFIARAQCLAAQCARPEVAGHPQCEAVRRQQQIEEEKRNPTLAN